MSSTSLVGGGTLVGQGPSTMSSNLQRKVEVGTADDGRNAKLQQVTNCGVSRCRLTIFQVLSSFANPHDRTTDFGMNVGELTDDTRIDPVSRISLRDPNKSCSGLRISNFAGREERLTGGRSLQGSILEWMIFVRAVSIRHGGAMIELLLKE